jgi:hypothetical protein
MDGSTWLEPYQGMDPEGCGAPVAPHVGGSFNYTYNDGVLTVHGAGAHLGLAKVTNQGQEGLALGDSIVYLVSFSGDDNDVMTVDAQYPDGYWRYVYTRPVPPPPPPVTSDITFSVDMAQYTNIAPGYIVNINGTFNGWCGDCNPMDDTDGDNVWEVTLPLVVGDEIRYKYTVNGWTDQEGFEGGESCTNTNDAGNTDRVLTIPENDITLSTVCFNSCETCPPPQRLTRC